MSRQQQRRNERAETISQDTLYDLVFAEVAAYEQELWTLCHDEDIYARDITAQLGNLSGLTHAERRDAITSGVGRYMGDVMYGADQPSIGHGTPEPTCQYAGSEGHTVATVRVERGGERYDLCEQHNVIDAETLAGYDTGEPDPALCARLLEAAKPVRGI